MNAIKNNLVLELHIPDFNLAREFYAAFGFEELSYDPASGGGSELGYMVLKREDENGRTLLNFYGDKDEVSQHEFFNTFSEKTPRGYGVEITIPVSDVEKLWSSIENAIDASHIVQSLMLKRWGQKDLRVVDPFGFYVRFTEMVDWGQ